MYSVKPINGVFQAFLRQKMPGFSYGESYAIIGYWFPLHINRASMVRMLWIAGLVAGIVLISGSAMAGDQLMVLYPHQRAAHQSKMDENAARYWARGQDYVDHLYATGGEEPMPESDDLLDELDDNVVPVDVGQVADMVKQQEKPDKSLPAGSSAR